MIGLVGTLALTFWLIGEDEQPASARALVYSKTSPSDNGMRDSEIWRAALDGTNPRRIAAGHSPAISPDGAGSPTSASNGRHARSPRKSA